MPDQEDYYQVLGVSPEDSLEEIRRAYRSKARDYHPDRLAGVSDAVRRLAEEKLKEINAAYGILGNTDKRRQYDSEALRKNSPPRPEVTPGIIKFDNVEPGWKQTGSFVVRNSGGTYSKIGISNPDTWLTVTGYVSLAQDDELPLQVNLEAQGQEFGNTYLETITVSLDDSEVLVTVELRTKAAARSASYVSPSSLSE